MAKYKVTRKELKEDEIHNIGVSLYHFFERNAKVSLGVVAGIVLLSIGYVVASDIRERSERTENERFGKALMKYERVFGPEADQPSEDIVLQLINTFDDLSKQYPKSPISVEALTLKGNLHLERGELAKARETFGRLSNDSTPLRKAQGHLALGDVDAHEAFETTGTLSADLERSAADNYQQAFEAAPKSYIGAYALLKKGRLLAANRETRREALDTFEYLAQFRAKDAGILAEQSREELNAVERERMRQLREISDSKTLAGIAEAEIERLRPLVD